MRLLTHNLLMCNRKQCTGGFPLRISLGVPKVEPMIGSASMSDEVENLEITRQQEAEFNPEFIRNIISQKIEWEALVKAAGEVGLSNKLPPSYSEQDLEDEMFLKAVHEVAVEAHVLEATLTCPKCSREFPVRKGIPNMLLHDDEV